MTDYASLAPGELAPYIQHTLIAVGTTREQTIAHAQQCVEHARG